MDDWQVPTGSAICQARQRLGAAPLKELFDRAAVPVPEQLARVVRVVEYTVPRAQP